MTRDRSGGRRRRCNGWGRSWRKRWWYKSAVIEGKTNVDLNQYWKLVGDDVSDWIFTDSTIEYYFYQISKILYGLITVLLGAGVAVWFFASSSDWLNQFASGERTIIVLLGAILFMLWRIGLQLAKR